MAPRGVAENPLRFTLGPLVVPWIERNLVHGPGDVQGERVVLDDEQVRFVFGCYRIDDRGRRVVRRAWFSRPKGRAKSELAAMLVCAEALGPVRFGGWGRDGLPLGRSVQSPYIPITATEEGQAGNVYAAVEFMLRHGPVSTTPGLDVGRTRTFLPDGGKIQAVTAKADSKDGGKETFAVFSETHLYVMPEHQKMVATIRRNLAKRKQAEPWSLEESTMFGPGEESVAEMTWRYAEAVREGKVKDVSLYVDHREAPAEFDYDDDDQLRAALADAYGEAAEWMDLDRMVAEARDPNTDEADFRRYFLNQRTVASNAWVSRVQWDKLEADPPRRLNLEAPEGWTVAPPGTEVALGFDGSYDDDSTALIGTTVEDEPHSFVVGVWERPDGAAGKGWVVPRDEVDDRVRWALEESGWKVVEFAADPPGWHREISRWADRYGDVVVTEFRTNARAFMARACKKAKAAVNYARVSHDGNPVLARHISNAVTKKTEDGEYITKDFKGSRRKIDAATAWVISYDRATSDRDGPSVYEERQMLVL